MSFTKTILSTLLLSFFLFNGNINAQLTVTSEGNVAIGTSIATSHKLRVYNTDEAYAANLGNYFNTSSTKYGLYSYNGSQGTGTKYGIYSTLYQNSGSSLTTSGIYSYVYPNGSGTGYGLRTSVSNVGSGTKYGVYSTINGGSGYAGYFVGDVFIDGTFTINLMSPNPTLKMAKVNNAADRLKTLSALAYQPTVKEAEARTKYTLDIASVKNAFPELVFETERPMDEEELVEGEEPKETTTPTKTTTVTSIDYNGLIPVLVEAIKEQQAQIEDLQNKLEALQN